MTFLTMVWDWLHSLPSLAKFALGMAIIVGIPPISPCPASSGSWLSCRAHDDVITHLKDATPP